MNQKDIHQESLSSTSERNHGIDLLRMLSMLMIVLHHILWHGGILNASVKGTSQYTIAWAIEIMVCCAVNCYALISGYVGIKSKFKYSNIAFLWLQVLFYSILITVVYSIYTKSAINLKTLLNALSPVSNKLYWYFTAYFCMFFFIPAMNFLVDNMQKRHLQITVLSIIALFSVFPTFAGVELLTNSVNDIFITSNGYSPLWLALLYIIGAYISKYRQDFKINHYACFFIYLIAVAIVLTEKLVAKKSLLGYYSSPTILICAISLLIIFSETRCKKSERLIKFFAPLSFGIYLIHDHPLVRSFIKGSFAFFTEFPAWKMLLAILGSALSIYVLCMVIDLIRHYFFKLLRIKKLLTFFEKTISTKIQRHRS